MAEDSPTLDELRQRIADIESGKLPARRKAALKTKASGLLRRAPLRPRDPTAPAAARWKAANERGYFSRYSHPRRDERQPTA